ncbi:hypothetical protein [Pseudoalteromonas sp. BDTF-M6]|uniref:hypothetical protein n=1 Tax=Pseudoalteromonas sp. BDTF-M6 TaxID=2796132 RepID=UPI001BB09964|nr:hypothetical protein [Pseudoalteromonas sp. BDTF-M6]MBS3796158.1 hypothetical protein [Pseudoalteromonas sp. BDTF-M6]
MHVDPTLLERVEDKLNNQNAVKAGLAGALWSMPLLVIWYAVYYFAPAFSPMMLFISGALIGFMARYHGQGYGRRFAVIGFVTHLILVVVAINIGIVITGTIWGVILLGLYLSGAWAAAFFARKGIPLTQNKAFYVLTEQQAHSSDSLLKNRWYVAVPLLLLVASLTNVATAFGIHIFHGINQQVAAAEDYQQELERHRAKAIDVTPNSLDKLTTKEALFYAYSYYTGRHVNARGQYKGEYPLSTFKAKTILNYLVKYRQEPRAAFILARVNEDKSRAEMLQTAIAQGDQYAKFYSVVAYGCTSEEKRAKQLLAGMQRLVNEEPIASDINTLMHYGFGYMCDELDDADFELRFLRDYSPKS